MLSSANQIALMAWRSRCFLVDAGICLLLCYDWLGAVRHHFNTQSPLHSLLCIAPTAGMPVWYDIFTPPYSYPRVKISYVTLSSPPYDIFTPQSQSRQYMTDISFIIAGVLFHPMSSSMGVNTVPRWIHPSVEFHWSNYNVSRYIHSHSLVPWDWLYHDTMYPPPLSSSMGVIMSYHDIFTPTL